MKTAATISQARSVTTMKNKLLYTTITLLTLALVFTNLPQNQEKQPVLSTHEDNTFVNLTDNISYSDYLTICQNDEEVLATQNASECLDYFNQTIS